MNRSIFAAALLAGTALAAFSAPSMAADDGFTAGSILVRVRAVEVTTQTQNSTVDVAGVGNIGGNVQTTNTTIPEIDGSYFFTPNLAVEVIAGTARVALRDKNPANTVTDNVALGNTYLLPPTATVQWHFLPKGLVNPYFGAGLNYTIFYDKQAGSELGGSLRLRDALGYAVQAGADLHITGGWYGNVDVKKIFLNTTAEERGGGLSAHVSSVRLDPWLLGVGVGYRF